MIIKKKKKIKIIERKLASDYPAKNCIVLDDIHFEINYFEDFVRKYIYKGFWLKFNFR